MYAKDVDGRYTFLNRAYCRLHGLSSAEMLDQTDERAVPPGPGRADPPGRAGRHCGQTPSARRCWRVAGGPRFMLTTRGPLFGIDGRLAGVFGIARDITTLRHDQEALREREEIYSAIVNQAADGIVLLDLGRRFTEFNDAACAGLGYSRDEFARLTLRDIKCPEITETESGSRRSSGAGLAPFESWYRHADGSAREVELSYRAVEIRGQPLRGRGVA